MFEDMWNVRNGLSHSDIFHFVAETVSEDRRAGGRDDSETVDSIESICLSETMEVECEGVVSGFKGMSNQGPEISCSKDMDFPDINSLKDVNDTFHFELDGQ